MATIKIQGIIIQIQPDLNLSCSLSGVDVWLDDVNRVAKTFRPGGYTPNPPHSLARYLVDLMGGEIVSFVPNKDNEVVFS